MIHHNSPLKAAKATRKKVSAPLTTGKAAAVLPEMTALDAALEQRPFDDNARHELISEAAYLRASQRGFEPGDELADWLAAEAEVDARLCGNT